MAWVLLGRSAGARRSTSPAVTGTVATSPAVTGTGATSMTVTITATSSLAVTRSWTPRRPPQRVARWGPLPRNTAAGPRAAAGPDPSESADTTFGARSSRMLPVLYGAYFAQSKGCGLLSGCVPEQTPVPSWKDRPPDGVGSLPAGHMTGVNESFRWHVPRLYFGPT